MNFIETEIKLDGVTTTPEGYLIIPAIITKAGVYPYPEYGTVEAKLPEDLFDPKSLATLENLIITREHPPTASKLLDASTAVMYQKGFTISKAEIVNGDELKIILKIIDKELIIEIQQGLKKYISLGAVAPTINEIGEYKGKKYNKRQVNIKYNHIAITAYPRVGEVARIVLDSNQIISENKEKLRKMAHIQLGKVNIEVDDKVATTITDYVEKLETKLDSLSTENLNIAKQLDLKTKENETLQEKATKLDSMNIDDLVNKRVAEKSKLAEIAKRFIKDVKLDSYATDKDLKVAIIKTKAPTFDEKNKDDKEIQVRLDSILDIFADYDVNKSDSPSPSPIPNLTGRFPNQPTPQAKLDSFEELYKKAEKERNMLITERKGV